MRTHHFVTVAEAQRLGAAGAEMFLPWTDLYVRIGGYRLGDHEAYLLSEAALHNQLGETLVHHG